MAASGSDDDEFGLSSGDEADLLQLAESAETNTNGNSRKHARNDSQSATLPPTKTSKISNGTDDSSELLKPQSAASTTAKTSKTSHETEDPSEVLELMDWALQTKFKMSSFRLKQAQAIQRILNGGSAVVVFPTGQLHRGNRACFAIN